MVGLSALPSQLERVYIQPEAKKWPLRSHISPDQLRWQMATVTEHFHGWRNFVSDSVCFQFQACGVVLLPCREPL